MSMVGNILNMKNKCAWLVLSLFLVLPMSALGSVRLNEIAWMGTEVSATDEWIELYNDSSSSVDLSGWHIEAEDGSPNILLTGSVLPNGYFLIERMDDTTVPNIPGDVVASFGNGLSNSGETLYIKDTNGVIQDTVIGGASWVNIGGDNTTKQTAQRLFTGNSWITATGTPRAVNVSSGEVFGASSVSQENTDTQSATTPSDISSGTPAASTGGTSKSTSVYPRKEITVFAGTDQRAFTGFSAVFSGSALGLYDEPLRYATYRWNFGDGATGEGETVLHVYSFPGEYTVTLEAFYGSLKNIDRILVTVSDPDVVILRTEAGSDGYVELSNRTLREIDLSGWSLVVHHADTELSKKFFFAPNTIVLGGKSVRFPYAVTQLDANESEVTLHAPNGTLVYTFGHTTPASGSTGLVAGVMSTKHEGETPAPTVVAQDQTTRVRTPTSAVANERKITESKVLPSVTETAATVLWERDHAPESEQFSPAMRWFFVFMGFLLLILAVFIIARSHIDKATIADEYAIIEDIIEGEADLVRKSNKGIMD